MTLHMTWNYRARALPQLPVPDKCPSSTLRACCLCATLLVWRPTLLPATLTPSRRSALCALQYTEQPGVCLTRTFFSKAHVEAAKQLAAWMQDAGMRTWIDVVGNVHGVLEGQAPTKPITLLGSHYDSVVDAGK